MDRDALTTPPLWARLLTFFLIVAGLRDIGLKLFALLAAEGVDARYASWQLWFVMLPGTVVGLLKVWAGIVAWSKPLRCRFWFTIMTVGIGVGAALQAPLGARMSHALQGGPSLADALTRQDASATLVTVLGGVAPYAAVTLFLFTGAMGRWFAAGEIKRACSVCGAPKGHRCPECGARVQVTRTTE